MNRKAITAVLLTGSAAVTLAAQGAEPKRPNVLYIMSDDHANQAISAYGSAISKLAPTPNIDRIAREGAILRANYCGNSLSGPSRASIMTGKHSNANGFVDNGSRFDGTQQTMPKIFKENGYQTAVIGKWHLVSKPIGFDHWQIFNDQGEYYNPDFITNGDTARVEGYGTDLVTQFTREWLDQRDPEKPFFVMMHHKAPHRNWWPAERHYGMYEGVTFPVPDNYFDNYEGRAAAEHQEMNIYRDMYEGHDLRMSKGADNDSLRYDPWPWLFERMNPQQRERFEAHTKAINKTFYDQNITDPKELAMWKYQRFLREYLATIAAVDESVGEILDYLAENGLLENTIVVYAADQSFYLGEHGWFDKRFMYEESMQMPFLIRYPDVIKPGTEVTALTQNIDFAPTFLDMCGLTAPEPMQGVSFKPLLEGHTPDDWRKSLYYHYYEYPAFHMVKPHCGVKTERYKLLHFYKDNLWELYDLKSDPTEMHNLYGQKGTEQITAALKTELKRLQAQYGDVNMPTASRP